MKKMLKSAKFRKFQQLTNQIGLVHAWSMDNLSTPCHCPWTTFGARNLDNCHKLQVYKKGQLFGGGQKKRGGPRGALSTPRRVDAEFYAVATVSICYCKAGTEPGNFGEGFESIGAIWKHLAFFWHFWSNLTDLPLWISIELTSYNSKSNILIF